MKQVLTIRAPKTLHEELRREAFETRKSINTICLQRIAQEAIKGKHADNLEIVLMRYGCSFRDVQTLSNASDEQQEALLRVIDIVASRRQSGRI